MAIRDLCLGSLVLVLGGMGSVVATAAEPLRYNRDIRPILAENCFACHGPDSAARQAELRLDRFDDAVADRGGSAAIVPEQPAKSSVMERVHATDPDLVMPPPSTKKTLTAEQIAKLERWIAEGAQYEPHWSFIRPVRPQPPEVKQMGWVRNPIDQFVLARLEQLGLEPAPEADRRSLARRASLDLTGLPPEPAAVDAFVNDGEPGAYERYVDRLLDSIHWGEHRGRYWLDAARYADTHGIHFDNYREFWAYRDWVIQAFNSNMPFDQFTIEQLAGDLLPAATLEQQIASGFNRSHITTNEGGIIDEEYLVLYTRDRTETMSTVWMGLTANCAVCHDHKFDPLSQREFYSLAAFFNNSNVPARDGNIKDPPPIATVPRPEDRDRWAALQVAIPQAQQRVAERKAAARPEFDGWLASATPGVFEERIPRSGMELHIPFQEAEGAANITVDGTARSLTLAEGTTREPGALASPAVVLNGAAVAEIPDVGDFEGDQPFTLAAWIKLSANDGVGAIAARMDNAADFRGWDFWVEGRRIGMHLINRWSDDALKVVSRSQVKANEWTHVVVTYDGSRKAAGVKVYFNGQPQPTNTQADTLKSTTRTTVPLKIGSRDSANPLAGAAVQDLRIYERALTPPDAANLAGATRRAAVIAKSADQRTDAEKNDLYDWWLTSLDTEYQNRAAALAGLEREQADIKSRGTVAHVMTERTEPAMAFILSRGEYDRRQDQVSAATPAVLPHWDEQLPRNRLGLAQWLLRADHPLTARVTVNRFWQEVFGTGLVRTAGDFGITGELPSHPELLDWLAVEFRESGWDVKKFFKLLVTSATYRQASTLTPEKLAADPANTWLSRGPRFRMDAEMVRDLALASSGLLVRKIGGPSVKPYQPDGVWEAVAMDVSNTREYRRDSGENLYRRSMYTFWKRSAPPASMDIFNAPSRETCSVRRERTNTPLQALVTLNDTQFVEAARVLAERVLADTALDDTGRMNAMAARILSRSLDEAEVAVVRSTVDDLRQYYAAHPEDADALTSVGDMPRQGMAPAGELAAWTMIANELFNMDEALVK